MRKALTLAVILLLASPSASWAVGSFSLTESDLIGTTSISETLSVSKLSGLTFGTITVGTVALAIEIEEMKPSAQSPHHNVTIISAGVPHARLRAAPARHPGCTRQARREG